MVIGICDELRVPVRYVGVGEGIDDLRPFDAHDYALDLPPATEVDVVVEEGAPTLLPFALGSWLAKGARDRVMVATKVTGPGRRFAWMRDGVQALSAAQIEDYLQREQPYDCAGSAKSETLGIALLDRIADLCTELIDSFRYGNAVKQGIPVAIVGAPNSGKSTKTPANEPTMIPGASPSSLKRPRASVVAVTSAWPATRTATSARSSGPTLRILPSSPAPTSMATG